MIIADYHVHSDFSSDSQAPMEQMIEQAIKLGLKRICFTDHMDYDYPPEGDYDFVFDPKAYFAKLEAMKHCYDKQIEIYTGIELGLQPHLTDRVSELMNSYPFDFAIGSSHVVDRMDPYYNRYWENKSISEGIRRYFESILENSRLFQNFHVYGHLDYIVRYAPHQEGNPNDYSYPDYTDLLDEVLKALIHGGKGIEINTAGLKYGLGYPHPKLDIIRRYRELGGELITIGSDAHKPEHLCYDFNMIPELLKQAGFRYYAVFTQGKPVYEKL